MKILAFRKAVRTLRPGVDDEIHRSGEEEAQLVKFQTKLSMQCESAVPAERGGQRMSDIDQGSPLRALPSEQLHSTLGGKLASSHRSVSAE